MKLRRSVIAVVVLFASPASARTASASPSEKLCLSTPNIAQAAPAPIAFDLKITIDIPELYGDGTPIFMAKDGSPTFPRTLDNQDPQAHFDVVIENISSHPVFLWTTGSSIGDRILTFHMTNSKGISFEVNSISVPYKKNAPYAQRLAPGDVQVREVYYNLKNPGVGHLAWELFPFPKEKGTKETVSLCAMVQQKIAPDGQNGSTWLGQNWSNYYSVILKNSAP